MKRLCAKLGEYASQALKEELDTTPKPALVDKRGSGVHLDMDYNLLCKSITALSPFWEKFSVTVADYFTKQKVDSENCDKQNTSTQSDSIPYGRAENSSHLVNKEFAQKLRKIGICAEKEMFAATKGINTHKGAVFCLGLAISSATLCALSGENKLADFSRNVSQISSFYGYEKGETHGSKAREKFHIDGALEIAQKGYPFLQTTCENFIADKRDGIDDNTANLKNLLYLQSIIEDTNVYYHGNKEVADQLKALSGAIYLKWKAGSTEYLDIEVLEKILYEKKASPGGSADMLALSIFVKKLLGEEILTLKI